MSPDQPSKTTRRFTHKWGSRERRYGDCVHPYEPTEPTGYVSWFEWVEKYAETHDCAQCPDCGLWAIWTPKESQSDA